MNSLGINIGHFEESTPFIANNSPNVGLMESLKLDEFRTIRFMDWQKINNSAIVEYHQLPVAHRAWQYNGGPWRNFHGVPLSLIIDTANDMNARPWVCIPHKASDDCIRRMVSLVISRSQNRPIFEFSNEVWNAQFMQYWYCVRRGWWARLATRPVQAALRWQAHRTAFLSDAVAKRGDVVIAAQAANSWIAEQLLDDPQLRGKVDALAIAPYFGQKAHNGNWADWDGLFRSLHTEIDQQVRNNVRQHRALASSRGLPLWGYEGGQHLLGRTAAQKQQFINLNRSPRMQVLTQKWLDVWEEEGGELICPYSFASRFDGHCWGYVEIAGPAYHPQPKLNALVEPDGVTVLDRSNIAVPQ